MKYTSIIPILSAIMILAGVATLQAGMEPTLITKDQLKAMLDDPGVIVVDVRRGKDWKSSEFKIKGAVYAAPDDYSSWAGVYPKDKQLVLYCA